MWAQGYSGSNNIHFDFPPIMTDGRIYSSYQPQSVVNDNLREKEKIKTNWEYRQYLTHNADKIAQFNSMEATNTLGLPLHPHTGRGTTSNTPFLFVSTTDAERPKFGYAHSDLKNPYLSREQLQAKLISPPLVRNS